MSVLLDQVLDIIVDDFSEKEEMFTSVDVANKIKKCGYWIRTKEVASYLRSWICSQSSYTQTQIDVKRPEDGAVVVANLYHPLSKSGNDYKTDGYALTPDDFSNLNKPEKLPKALKKVSPKTVSKTTLNINPDGDSLKTSLKSDTDASKNVEVKKDTIESKKDDSKKKKDNSQKSSSGRSYNKFNFL